ncbi:GNAT family N-acetyltransferase [Natrarchaeobius oligotrophus]|uniref:N-acetyltransferase n=1 Tax=Natrarchaeobius chitinivorans TaxID=1679083 RepID=A0A3N6N6D8_NATCH|nr:GNAT family protein [Natrarchaeobius chitinivorans]RQH03517.1 N-acetyltransferase [Natrarchaeobius chitinivorans]
MYPERLETDALVLEQFCEERVDVFELYARFARGGEGVDDVFEYVPQEPYASVKEARDQLVEAQASWDEAESAQYVVYTADGSLAGYTGLFPEWDRRAARIGFTLGTEYWGNGYAGECATALADLAFGRLDLEVVALDHADGNERSKRAIETVVDTAGGQYDGRLRNWRPIGDEVADHHRYTITREQYRQSRRDA